jgi:hypothetical protein
LVYHRSLGSQAEQLLLSVAPQLPLAVLSSTVAEALHRRLQLQLRFQTTHLILLQLQQQ